MTDLIRWVARTGLRIVAAALVRWIGIGLKPRMCRSAASVTLHPVRARASVAVLVLTLAIPGCRVRDLTRVDAGSAVVALPAGPVVVRGSQQPKCLRDSDCAPHHACVCREDVCSVKGYGSEDADEPTEHFCVPLASLWGGELPPELRDAGLERR
jgi:hypothetical protein